MKIRLADCLDTLAQTGALNLCADDSRLLSLVNRACERLMAEGSWLGTVQRIGFYVYNGDITWPREIETIISGSISGYPLTIRNGWYEHIETGPGELGSGDTFYANQLIDRGQAVSFDDISGTSQRIKVKSDVTEADGASILLRYWDENGEPVRTPVTAGSTTLIYGETLALNTTGATTSKYADGGLVEVVKPVTRGSVRLYQYDEATGEEWPIAVYAPDETVPVYRRSLIPGLPASTISHTVIVNAKLRFIALSEDDDILPIQSMEAVRLAVQAVDKEEKGLFEEAQKYMYGLFDQRTGRRQNGAVPILEAQLRNAQGAGLAVPIRMASGAIFGAGDVQLLR